MRKAVLALMILLTTSTASFALEYQDPAPPPDVGGIMGRKLGRGLGNIFCGWLEIPKSISEVNARHNFIAGLTWGTLQGVGKALTRTAVGVIETVTFIIPSDPIIQPEFVLPSTTQQ
ncbi:MAG: exosortase system-associated protein, TIGR04073 family [Candidatus Omnitrophica bacterium]|nr:exosortase system-associated protein, TIGR04073 family [Candidatus Omnitrophota bacterium]